MPTTFGTVVTLNGPDIMRQITTHDGSLERLLRRKGAMVENEAKRLASNVLVNVQTGRYRSSIAHRLTGTGEDLTVHIGTNVEYAQYLEKGTRYIRARWVLRTALVNAGGR